MTVTTSDQKVTSRVYARIGLLGNPSDGFYGKTISISLANFHAEVTLQPSHTIVLVPHPQHDPLEFPNLTSLADTISGQGFYGGIRLLMATCKRFFEYFRSKDISLPQKGFTLSYDTNIPRQSGLSGSSGIVCAALNCLLQYYNVCHQCPIEDRPSLVLAAEQDLGITAGLQDRVIQVYGGVVYMDFDRQYMLEHSHGRYIPLDPQLLPPLYIMYSHALSGKDSGKVHRDVKQKWEKGDQHIHNKMKEVAELAESGRRALESGDMALLAQMMDKNFSLRREIFGDGVVGAKNIRMVELAQQVGAVGKLTGSGGAVVVLCSGTTVTQQAQKLQALCEREGFVLKKVEVGPSNV